jgi:hypothetical protein
VAFFAIIETFPFFFWGRVQFFLFRFSEFFVFSSESFISFLIYFVRVSSGFGLLKIAVFVIFLILLKPFSEIVVEADYRRD